MFFVFLISTMFSALVAQHFLGAVPPWGARICLVPLVFLYGALSFSPATMLLLGFLAGISNDLLHAQCTDEVIELGAGTSVLVYWVLGMLATGLRPLFLRGRWEVHCIFSGIATSVLVAVEYLMISFRREPLTLEFNQVVWGRILGAGIVALALSPVVFAILGYFSRLLGHKHYRSESKEA